MRSDRDAHYFATDHLGTVINGEVLGDEHITGSFGEVLGEVASGGLAIILFVPVATIVGPIELAAALAGVPISFLDLSSNILVEDSPLDIKFVGNSELDYDEFYYDDDCFW